MRLVSGDVFSRSAAYAAYKKAHTGRETEQCMKTAPGREAGRRVGMARGAPCGCVAGCQAGTLMTIFLTAMGAVP